LRVEFASTPEMVREAQQLRWRVFADEFGARLSSPVEGVDMDRYDPHCEHLLVRDAASGDVVGTYRILSGERSVAAGGFYSETEFDLGRVKHLRGQIMEMGRACVHPDYRSGATITLLWAGLADFILRHKVQYLLGCASIPMHDGGQHAAAVFRRLERDRMAAADWRVFPHCRLPLERLRGEDSADIPALIRAYLRIGAVVCGEPAWDPDFNTADLLLMLPTSKIDHRYARHFLGSAEVDRLL
jgi:putative hemolysin